MTKRTSISVLFVIAALYDGLLGVVFLSVPAWAFQTIGVTPPNHFGYVQFPAALLIAFALMFLAIAQAPERNRSLIPYGMLLKVSYCGVAGFHWLTTDIPWIWKPFAVADLLFLAAFLWAYAALRRSAGAS